MHPEMQILLVALYVIVFALRLHQRYCTFQVSAVALIFLRLDYGGRLLPIACIPADKSPFPMRRTASSCRLGQYRHPKCLMRMGPLHEVSALLQSGYCVAQKTRPKRLMVRLFDAMAKECCAGSNFRGIVARASRQVMLTTSQRIGRRCAPRRWDRLSGHLNAMYKVRRLEVEPSYTVWPLHNNASAPSYRSGLHPSV